MMKKHLLKSVLTLAMLLSGMNIMALESYDFQDLCMALGKGGPWAVNDGGDAGFTVNDATMHYLGDYTDQGFTWNQRFAYEYVEGRDKFTMRNKNNKKDNTCGMFSWDYAHYFSILDLKDGDKVTITIGAGTVTFVNEAAEGILEGDNVVSKQAYTISTTEESTRLDIQMAKATLIYKIEIEPYGVETVPVITVTPQTLKLIPTATAKLTASVSPAAETTWSSSDESVATVAADGTVTAIAAGTAIIKNSWASQISDATAEDGCEIIVADVDLSAYTIAKSYDFTTMGDVTLELGDALGKIWNDANSQTNIVYYCTNEGLEDIAVQAAAGTTGKGWSIADGQGLYLGSGAGRCAAIAGLKAGQIVEFFYTGSTFATRSNADGDLKNGADVGAAKTALNEGVGRAIYQLQEDGAVGFELAKGNAVKKINIYELPAEQPALENIAALKAYDAQGTEDVVLTLTNAKVTYVGTKQDLDWDTWEYVDTDVVVFEDASAGIMLQGSGLGTLVTEGQTLNGKLAMSIESVWGEINAKLTNGIEGVEVADGTVTPLALNDDNLFEYLAAPDWKLVELKDVTFEVVSEEGYDDELHIVSDQIGDVGIMDALDYFDIADLEGAVKAGLVTGYVYSLYGGMITAFQPIKVESLVKSYQFVASEWIAGDAGRISPEKVVAAPEANTVTVSQTGQNNVALIFRSSNVYEVKAEQRYFVIKGTGMSTAAGASYLWWLNNTNNGSQIEPTDIYEEDGQTVFAWDCATIAIGGQLGQSDTEFKDEGGWSTTFGMTLADQEVPAVISYIGFEEEIQNPVEEFEYEFVASEWPAGDPGRISASNVVVDEVANTITVDAKGDNNVALNFKTDKVYYLPEPVKYFVIQATGLSTEVGKSYLWWLNAKNNGGQVVPTDIISGDVTTFVWDITADATFASGFNAEGKSYLDGTGTSSWGWTTTFGLTLADQSVPAVISYIGYETEDSSIVTGINSASMKQAMDGTIYNLQGQRVDKAAKGLYIINGKKVMMK